LNLLLPLRIIWLKCILKIGILHIQTVELFALGRLVCRRRGHGVMAMTSEILWRSPIAIQSDQIQLVQVSIALRIVIIFVKLLNP